MVWTRQQLRETVLRQLADQLFIVVSNREPYVHRFEGEQIICETPPSGLTIALDPVVQAGGGVWVAHGSGDADRETVDAQDRVRVPPDSPNYLLRRVWLTKEEELGYYYGFANEALWPLCHIAYTRPTFNESDWHTYQLVNRRFAEAVLEEVGDRRAFVFIQDYHFALLSRFLKKPHIRTAQFWHIPWPNPEAFQICPWAEEILDGLLGNDLLGFHILYHCQNFIQTVERTIEAKIDYERSEITRGGMKTLVKPFPISVDFDAITEDAKEVRVQHQIAQFVQRYGLKNRLIGLGVDRIDYTKGIPERLQALNRFLERYPEFQGRLVFVQIGVPSRVHIGTYKQLNDEIDQLVESINWKYQREGWKPIVYIKQHTPATALRAWYRLARFCIVSSLHDGMNLVAKEFVASRVDEDGVLLLSHFTGAAREMTDALLMNPYAIDEVSLAIYRALSMEPSERKKRMMKMRLELREQNIYRWAAKVLSTLFRFDFEET